jgi:hypothetical protein
MLGEGSFDLAELEDEGETEELVSTDLVAGNYTQLRVIMNEELGVQVDYDENEGDPVDAKLPSGELKFVRPFTIEADGSTEIILDFDLQKSVVFTGNFDKGQNPNKPDKPSIIVKPVVKLQVTSTPGDQTSNGDPSIPGGLVATPGDGEVSLDWDDNSEADLEGYNVYRADIDGGPYTKIAEATVSEYTDTGLTNGTIYYYVVTAVDNSDQESDNSSQVAVIPGL